MSIRSMCRVATLCGGVLLVAGAAQPVRAQGALAAAAAAPRATVPTLPERPAVMTVVHPVATVTDTANAAPRGPEAAPVGLRAVTAARSAPADAEREKDMSVGGNVALMGVGAAALVVGLLIGGDAGTAIAVGGGAIGLVGLYRYLR